MKPTSTPSSVNKSPFGAAILLILFSLFPPAALAVEDLGAHRFRGMDEFQRVIDTRCAICHTRERVDVAIKKRASLERLEARMVERGAILTEEDKNVLGTFWGNPLRSEGDDLPAHETESLK